MVIISGRSSFLARQGYLKILTFLENNQIIFLKYFQLVQSFSTSLIQYSKSRIWYLVWKTFSTSCLTSFQTIVKLGSPEIKKYYGNLKIRLKYSPVSYPPSRKNFGKKLHESRSKSFLVMLHFFLNYAFFLNILYCSADWNN